MKRGVCEKIYHIYVNQIANSFDEIEKFCSVFIVLACMLPIPRSWCALHINWMQYWLWYLQFTWGDDVLNYISSGVKTELIFFFWQDASSTRKLFLNSATSNKQKMFFGCNRRSASKNCNVRTTFKLKINWKVLLQYTSVVEYTRVYVMAWLLNIEALWP